MNLPETRKENVQRRRTQYQEHFDLVQMTGGKSQDSLLEPRSPG